VGGVGASVPPPVVPRLQTKEGGRGRPPLRLHNIPSENALGSV
jgi:hypothetical protein